MTLKLAESDRRSSGVVEAAASVAGVIRCSWWDQPLCDSVEDMQGVPV